ncbi:hypothetical protein [Pontibacter sp. H249]|uniref:hypothetical protein n=1 Tax=Pontibacter sp. H249 TaxID=3133420 RepID=UPI0030C599C2
MTQFVKIVFLGLALFVIEFLLCTFLLQLDSIYQYKVPPLAIESALKDSIEINSLRLILYFPLWIAAVYYLPDYIAIKKATLRLAIKNSSLYIILSLFYSILFPFAVAYFTESFFFILVLSTFTSPFILSFTPYAKRIFPKTSSTYN